jgi:Ca-activated chloride channel family protein
LALALSLAFSLTVMPRPARAWELFRSQSSAVERGNEHLKKGQHKEALEAYDEAARELPNDPSVQLDRGLALLGLNQLPQAREAFRRAGAGNAPKEVRGPALYDLGAAFMQEADQAGKAEDLDGAKKLLEESVDAFRGSLRAQPSNKDAAWNLELAKRRLIDVEKKQEEKKKQEEEKKKEEEKKDEQDKDQDKSDDENKDDKKEPQPDAGSPKEGDDEKPNEQDGQGEPDAGAPPQPEPKQGPDGGAPEQPREAESPEPQPAKEEPNALPEHMKNALDALESGEENLEKQRAKQRARSRPRRIEKDW